MPELTDSARSFCHWHPFGIMSVLLNKLLINYRNIQRAENVLDAVDYGAAAAAGKKQTNNLFITVKNSRAAVAAGAHVPGH